MEISSFASNSADEDSSTEISAFQALVPTVEPKQKAALKEVMSKVTLLNNFTLPTSKLTPTSLVAMSNAETGQAVATTTGQLMDALSTGVAEILPGSTSERLLLEADGETYVVEGHFAHRVLSGAMEVAGYFGSYQLTSAVVSGDLVLFDDEDVPVIMADLDGNEAE